ncbi:hypothetical protein [Asticcacaulis benevestitus]|nr:hypothetical protein [Asticcacaulis benevestitus]
MTMNWKIVVAATTAITTLTGCQAFNFAPPNLAREYLETDNKLCRVPPTTIESSLKCLDVLQVGYHKAADQLANGVQILDLPIIAFGSSILHSSVFSKNQKGVKDGSVAIATLLAGRQYYQVASRRVTLLKAAASLQCIAGVGNKLRGLDDLHLKTWKEAYAWSASQSTPVAISINHYAPMVINAHIEIGNAVDSTQNKLQQQWATPTEPAFADMNAYYKAVSAELKSNEESARNAALTATSASINSPMGFAPLSNGGKDSTYANLISDEAFLLNLSNLHISLDECQKLSE